MIHKPSKSDASKCFESMGFFFNDLGASKATFLCSDLRRTGSRHFVKQFAQNAALHWKHPVCTCFLLPNLLQNMQFLFCFLLGDSLYLNSSSMWFALFNFSSFASIVGSCFFPPFRREMQTWRLNSFILTMFDSFCSFMSNLCHPYELWMHKLSKKKNIFKLNLHSLLKKLIVDQIWSIRLIPPINLL